MLNVIVYAFLVTTLSGFPIMLEEVTETKGEYRILLEGEFCYPITVDTTMHWYGIYRTNKVDSLVEIKLKPVQQTSDGQFTWSSIATDRSHVAKANYIFGSRKALKNKVVSRHEMYSTHLIYPGMSYSVYGVDTLGKTTNPKTLSAIGNVKQVRHCPIIENYRLLISETSYDNPQDLTIYFEYESECGMYHIMWFGDIDDDHTPDLIFQSADNKGGEIILFLSSEAKEGKHVEKVANFEMLGCC